MKRTASSKLSIATIGLLSGCALFDSGTKTPPTDQTFKDSFYGEFPAPMASENEIERFNIFFCLNRPSWIRPSETCDIVDEAQGR